MDKGIKTGQLSFLILSIVPVTKLMMLPALFSEGAGRDAWLGVLLLLLADLAVLLSVLACRKIAPDLDFAQLLTRALGKVPAKILLAAYALFFFVKSVSPLAEQEFLFRSTLYETMPRYSITIPFVLVAAYVCYKGLTAIGRNASLTVWPACISLLVLLLLASPVVTHDNILPVLADGFPPVAGAMFKNSVWFGDYALFLTFLGRIQTGKSGKTRGVFLTAAAASAVVLVFFYVITGIFGPLTSAQFSAIAKIGKFNIALSNLGRFDWIFIILLMLPVFFASAAMLYGAVWCASRIFGEKVNVWVVVAAAALLLALAFTVSGRYRVLFDALQAYLSYPAVIMQYFLPPLMPILAIVAKRRTEVAYAKKQPEK